MLGEGVITSAVLDRLVLRSRALNIRGESCRPRRNANRDYPHDESG